MHLTSGVGALWQKEMPPNTAAICHRSPSTDLKANTNYYCKRCELCAQLN